jgi:hypothetical protein
MAATSWQHIRTLGGDVERTLEALRCDVFAARAFYLADEPACVPTGPGAGAARLERPSTVEDAVHWNGAEGTHSVLDITAGVSRCPSPAAVSVLAPELAERCFGNARPTLFDVLMTDFDAADVCEAGTGRYFVIAEPEEPTLVVFVGRTGS